MKNRDTLKFISNNIKGCKAKIVSLSIVQIFLGVLTVAFSFFLRFVIEAFEKGNKEQFITYTVALAVIAVLIVAFQIFYRLYYEVSYSDIENKLKNNLFKTLLNNNYQEIKKTHDEEWIHRLTSDTAVVASSILTIFPSLCRMVVQLVLALVAIIWLYPIFGLSLLPFIVLVILITYFLRKRLKAYHHLVQEKDGKAKVFFFESLQGLSIVHSFVKEDIFVKKNENNLEEYKKARLKRNVFSVICSISYVVVYYAFYILAIVFCGIEIFKGNQNMSIGLLAALMALLTQITGPLGNITAIIPRYYSLLASGERLRIQKDEEVNYLSKEEIDDYYSKEFKSLSLNNVSFSYLDKYGNEIAAIKDFSLSINKNEKVLIKGYSGGGKTTLFKLLLSLLTPNNGLIILKDKGEHNLEKKYEKLFAYVPQDNLLMEGTIKEVVSLFAEEPSQEQLIKALEISDSLTFVNNLPLKEETFLNEKGSGLSLGEMERIAIARAIYCDAPILLLDECSASLDAQTEKRIISNLLSLENKTIVLISHHRYDESSFDQVIDLGE